MGMSLARKTINFTSGVVDFAVLLAAVILIAFSGYALWDANQVYEAAKSENYAIYKPGTEEGGLSFGELQEINDEVFAWLTVYGTSIDYPVAQGEDNMKYVYTNAEGRYAASGSVFIDYKNSRDFSDFNTIFYGHHMASPAMFGDIGKFRDEEYFAARKYGNLYFDGKDHGIEFFSFLHTDVHNYDVFCPKVTGAEKQQAYLDGLMEISIYTRDIGVTIEDNIILLTTCSSESTNGRDILTGRLTDEVFEDTLIGLPAERGLFAGIQSKAWMFANISPILIFLLILVILLGVIFKALDRLIKV